jgi:phosphate uptake regulator
MAIDPSVRIDIAAEFTGKKAFDKADKSTVNLNKSVKKLAKGFLGVFAIQKLVSYSKASVKAFAEDDAAAKSLGMTLKNLGLAYSSNVGTVNGFINRLEAQTGVLDDELRPAMDRLLRATGDVAKSQELLNLSLDIAAGTGKSVTQVSQSLQKAYLGQTAAIGRLGVGISKAELATGNFEDIQKKLNLLFAGQATSAANSYQGSLDKLTVASNNAKETIGKGLVDALAILSNSSTVDPTVSAIDKISDAMAGGIKETAKFIKVVQTLFSDLSFFSNKNTVAEALRIKMGTGFTTPMTISSQDTQRADKLAADAAKKAAAAKIAAEKAAANAKIRADKLAAANKAKLDKAAAVFDLQKIQIAAALKGKISDEEKTRLLLMQAIADEDADKAEKLAKKLEEIQAKNAKIAADLLAIGAAKDPFATWAGSLSLALAELGKLGLGLADVPGLIPGVNFNPNQNKDRNYDMKVAAVEAAVALAAIEKDPALTSSIFSEDDTITDILTKVENAAADAAAAAEAAATSVTQSQITVDALAAAAINVTPGQSATGSSSMFNPYGTTPGSSSGYGMQSPTIIVNNNGSVIMQDEFVDAVNNALLAAERTGYNRTPAGFLIT